MLNPFRHKEGEEGFVNYCKCREKGAKCGKDTCALFLDMERIREKGDKIGS